MNFWIDLEYFMKGILFGNFDKLHGSLALSLTGISFPFFLELRENLSRLGANLKQSLIDSARKTWESLNEFARAHSSQGPDEQDSVVEEATEVTGERLCNRQVSRGYAVIYCCWRFSCARFLHNIKLIENLSQ